jgi:hypothetical protein
MDYVFGKDYAVDSMKTLFALQGLQIISSEHPEEPVRMIVELQLVLQPYFEGRAVSHLLYKILRCNTGSLEMVRDFFQEYFQQGERDDSALGPVRDIAVAARAGRPVPGRDRVSRRPPSKEHILKFQ